jgi:tRNA uracil 4-sulfurtransferase
MKKFLLIHYSEIGLKGANKEYFVGKLRKQLKEKLEGAFKKTFVVKQPLGRIMVELEGKVNEEKYARVVERIFGIKNFMFVDEGSIDLDEMGRQILDNMPKFEKRPETFRVKVKRSQIVPYKSIEAEREIGAVLLRNGIDMKVKMKGAEFVVNVEIFNEHSYYAYRKYDGAGGLSANTGSKLIATISSGFDSPVAAYRMMRRGARIIFVHFHAVPYIDDTEIGLVKDLVKTLGEYQFDTKLYLVPYGQIQENISINDKIPAKIRTVLYRRFMLRIAEKIARKEKAKGIVTGDNFGQVASQTPENLFVIDEASGIPVYRPLIANDKEEIIEIARKIGTHDLSAVQVADPCTRYAPKHPEIKANLRDVLGWEELLDVDGWVEEAFKGAEVVGF